MKGGPVVSSLSLRHHCFVRTPVLLDDDDAEDEKEEYNDDGILVVIADDYDVTLVTLIDRDCHSSGTGEW